MCICVAACVFLYPKCQKIVEEYIDSLDRRLGERVRLDRSSKMLGLYQVPVPGKYQVPVWEMTYLPAFPIPGTGNCIIERTVTVHLVQYVKSQYFY